MVIYWCYRDTLIKDLNVIVDFCRVLMVQDPLRKIYKEDNLNFFSFI